jgi:hypothetical protein
MDGGHLYALKPETLTRKTFMKFKLLSSENLILFILGNFKTVLHISPNFSQGQTVTKFKIGYVT